MAFYNYDDYYYRKPKYESVSERKNKVEEYIKKMAAKGAAVYAWASWVRLSVLGSPRIPSGNAATCA